MMRKLALVASSVLLALAASLAVLWWWLLFHSESAFPSEHAGKVLIFDVAVFVIQFLSLLLLGQLLARAWRDVGSGLAWLAVAGGFFLLFANALYFFTPAVGSIVILPALLLALVAKLVAKLVSEQGPFPRSKHLPQELNRPVD